MPIVLGLDLSQTRTGWAVLGTDLPLFGHMENPAWGDDEPEYLSAFGFWLEMTICEYKVTDVFYEETFIPPPRRVMGKRGKLISKPAESFANRFAQLALVAITQMTAYDCGCTVRVVKIKDWRERYIGTSRSPPNHAPGDASRRWFKSQAITASNLLGWYTADDNEAEALGIAHYGMCCIDKRYTENTHVHTARMQKRFEEIMRDER